MQRNKNKLRITIQAVQRTAPLNGTHNWFLCCVNGTVSSLCTHRIQPCILRFLRHIAYRRRRRRPLLPLSTQHIAVVSPPHPYSLVEFKQTRAMWKTTSRRHTVWLVVLTVCPGCLRGAGPFILCDFRPASQRWKAISRRSSHPLAFLSPFSWFIIIT